MERIVVLNSGGFDSVCLCYWLRDKYPEAEIHSLHFEYGNRNRKMETRCAKRACKKLNMVNHSVKLKPIKWSRSTLYGHKNSNEFGDEQYLEYRNLIFLSYAASLAESVNSHKIYMALIPSIDGHEYIDCTSDFVCKVEEVLSASAIEILTPFIHKDKKDFKHIAVKHKLTKRDYFSCNQPAMGIFPCGFCPDCLALKNIFLKQK